ncbi:Uncharacterised protein [Klebsiella pneumoniae]|nr:hypothetical protein SL84_05137 [Klebsiella pneumoniae]CAF2023029.1 hypothetical protein AI2621V1_5003 [Klebsiella pneumoniae]CAH5354793.1 hypothetical protein AI2621V1_5003 [Klebsiella pneumoniae]SVM31122.1 Uncharacterised protein [Klebsiella pneumoniae]SVU02231.1 Uncharacterised protein [Klebsiella pneumoniae]
MSEQQTLFGPDNVFKMAPTQDFNFTCSLKNTAATVQVFIF